MKTINSIALILVFFATTSTYSQDTIMPLWPEDKIPNRIASEEREAHVQGDDLLRISKVQEPTIEVYLPAQKNANGQAMLIFPGGGYQILAYDWEGTDIAKFLNSKGIAGIVVKYRLPSSASQKDKHLVPLIDAQRALRLVRSQAKNFNIETDEIGAIGFSAGGHLTATLGTYYNEDVYDPVDEVDTQSARPDFMALGYAVITRIRPDTDKSAKKEPFILDYFSIEKKITSETPPTFLFHGADDPGVPVAQSLSFFQALKDKGVSATMHIYPTGGHGFSLARDNAHVRGWTERLFEWAESLE